MWKTALKPKWLALLALVAAVIVAFGQLGMWQLNVARDQGHVEAMERVRHLPPVDLASHLVPHATMTEEIAGRTVYTSGTYDTSRQLLVAGRRLGQTAGYWVATPLVVDGSGGRLVIIRGFTSDPADVPPAAKGKVRVEGMLAPGEAAPNEVVELPAGQIATVELAELVNTWPGELYNAMIFPTSQTPADPPGLTHIPPPPLVANELAWRNLAYALQWWFFAGFALYMWWRMVREEHERLSALATVPVEPSMEAASESTASSDDADRPAHDTRLDRQPVTGDHR